MGGRIRPRYDAGSVARPVLTVGQAVLIATACAITLALWIAVLVVSKPLVLRWSHVRRFRRQLRHIDVLAAALRTAGGTGRPCAPEQ